MNKKEFEKLVASVKQPGKIKRGEMKASRVVDLKPMDIREVRKKLNLSQSEFALMIGVRLSTLQFLGFVVFLFCILLWLSNLKGIILAER